MRRSRSPSSPGPYRAMAHQQMAVAGSRPKDTISLIRSFNTEANPSRPMRPSPLTASTIRDMPLDLVDRIRSFPLFMSAPDEFLVEIGNHLKPQIHGKNENVVAEGDEAKAMYWLVRGVVAVTSRDGEAVYAELKPGAFFGEIGVLMDMPRTATIVAKAKCLLLVLKKEDLQAVMPKFPEMEQAIRHEAQERLNLLKKRRQEVGPILQAPTGDIGSRTAAPGEVAMGEKGAIKDGTVVNHKKRKSPSPGIIEDPVGGSAIASGLVNIRKTLKELPLFSTLPPDVLHFLGLSAQPKVYPPFTDIVQQGTIGNEIFFIVRGEAEVVHETQNKDNTRTATRSIQKRPRLKAGQYFGEVTSLGLSPGRTATVRSITTVECLMIPGDALQELWSRSPPTIKSQVEETARMRFSSGNDDDDIAMPDADAKEKPNKSDPPTPTTPVKMGAPHVTFTSPSKPTSPTRDSSGTIERKDPDPFLSVDMENIRNRRRHSLAPPTSTDMASSSPLSNGLRPQSLIETSTIRAMAVETLHDTVRAKRARTSLPHRPHTMVTASLSDDILVRIFNFLGLGDILRLRQICSHWRKLLNESPDVCKHIDLASLNRKVTDKLIVRLLGPFIGTRPIFIDLSNCFHITDEGFSALWKSCGKNVQTWKMRSVWDVSATQILEMSENAKGLEEIDWSNCRKVGDHLLGRVVGWVVPAQSPNRQQVVISSSGSKPKTRSQSQQQQQLQQLQQRQQQQQQQRPNMPPPGTVIGCPKLHTLNLSYCKHITDRSMAHLAAHASNRLQSLSLTRCTSITDAGFQSWASFKFEKLTKLCLADCTYLSDNAIVALVNSAKHLTHLDLSFCCALSDTATEVVALGLPRLRELRLAFCGSAVSDGSLESVALHLSDLEGLSVRGCVRVTGKGVENLMRGCHRLKWIDASQCRNLEPWLRMGGIMKWGYDERAGKPPRLPDLAAKSASTAANLPMFHMNMAMLATNHQQPDMQSAWRAKRPVKFIVEKTMTGLR